MSKRKRKPRPRLHNGDSPTYEFRLTERELESVCHLLENALSKEWDHLIAWMDTAEDQDRRRIMNACVALRNRIQGRL